MDGGAWCCSPWGHCELDTTECLRFHFSLSFIGEGNGNPLQCSCLENPRDGGAWWAAVYGVKQSRTRSDLGEVDWSDLAAAADFIFDWSIKLLLFSCSVVSDSLWPHRLQHSRIPCPSPSHGVCSNSCPLSQWCHPTISSSFTPFSSCPQSFPASRSFPMSWLFVAGGQSAGASASESVFPVNIQDWLIWSPCAQGTLKSLCQYQTLKSSILQRSVFLIVQLSHPHMTTCGVYNTTYKIGLSNNSKLNFIRPP